MIFLFVDASIYYTLTLQNVPKSLRYGIFFKFAIALVIHCSSILYCGTHAFWVTVSKVLPHIVSTSVFPLIFNNNI